jgi:hypothetical protein
MEINELRLALQAKMLQLEVSIESGLPYPQLMELYKEIKELKYQILIREISAQPGELA